MKTFSESNEFEKWEEIPLYATPMEAVMAAPGQWQWTSVTYIVVPGTTPQTGSFSEFVDTLPEREREI
jgi:hypothetical protein